MEPEEPREEEEEEEPTTPLEYLARFGFDLRYIRIEEEIAPGEFTYSTYCPYTDRYPLSVHWWDEHNQVYCTREIVYDITGEQEEWDPVFDYEDDLEFFRWEQERFRVRYRRAARDAAAEARRRFNIQQDEYRCPEVSVEALV